MVKVKSSRFAGAGRGGGGVFCDQLQGKAGTVQPPGMKELSPDWLVCNAALWIGLLIGAVNWAHWMCLSGGLHRGGVVQCPFHRPGEGEWPHPGGYCGKMREGVSTLPLSKTNHGSEFCN